MMTPCKHVTLGAVGGLTGTKGKESNSMLGEKVFLPSGEKRGRTVAWVLLYVSPDSRGVIPGMKLHSFSGWREGKNWVLRETINSPTLKPVRTLGSPPTM